MNRRKGAVFAVNLMREYRGGALDSEIHRKWKFPRNFKSKRKRLNYLFLLLSIDYGMRAEKLFEKVRNLAERSPEWFDFEFVSEQRLSKIERVMRVEFNHRFPKQAALRWKNNSVKIIKENIYLNAVFIGNTNEILSNIELFYGFGPKLSRLLLRSVVDLEVVRAPKGFELMELPTDVHVINLAERSGLFDKKPSASEARRVWTEVSLSEGIVPVDLDRALWALGADFCFRKRCLECPVKELCLKPVIKIK